MTRFLLIRHALTDAVGKSITGRQPGVHLNEQGRAQASALAERLSRVNIDKIYSSPMERAMETANAIAEAHNLQVSGLDALNEIDFGHWIGRTIEELSSDPVFQLFNSFRSSTRIPGGETMAEVQTRMVAGIELLRNNKHNNIALVSHADAIKAVVAFYAGMHLDMMQRIEISPASVSIIELYPETARITLVNGFTA